jgi:hypothetical protein
MDQAVEQGAKAAAAKLSGTFGDDLPMQVESELHPHADARPGQYLDPVSLGALIVSIASLAWTIYTDLRKPSGPPPAPEVVARTVRVQLNHPNELTQPQLAQVIEVTVQETLRAAQGAGI